MAKPKPLLQCNVSSKEGMSAVAVNNNKKKNHKHAPEAAKDACEQQQDSADVASEAAPLQAKGRGGAPKSRRRLARGPRSGDVVNASCAPSGGAACTNGVILHSPPPPPSSSPEDHRVVSTHFHDGATQAVLKVTILAAGFVIGARGISARLIGQVTGAVVHSWTERTSSASRPPPPDSPPPPPPVRLFRIEGKRASVQAAVALIQEAVSKYKELCECKRRGEFVQREHLIGGVEFYYHPPPRKALTGPPHTPMPPMRKLSPPLPPPPPRSCAPSNSSLISGSPHAWNSMPPRLPSPSQPPPPPHCPSPQPFLLNWRLQPPSPPPLPESLIGAGSAPPLPPPHLLPNLRLTHPPPPAQLHAGGSGSSCMASIEQSLQRVRLESNQEAFSANQSKAKLTELIPPPKLHYSVQVQQQQQRQHIQQYCSLFSVFGNGGHPVPIAQTAVAAGDAGGGAAFNRGNMTGVPPPSPPSSGTQPLQAAATAFEFTACDFLRESLPLPSFATASKRHLVSAAAARPTLCMPTAAMPLPEYCLFGQHKPSTGPLLMPPPTQFNGDLSQWPPLMR